MNDTDVGFDYKDTLNLPVTNFPMKANLANEEPKILAFWQQSNLYEQLQQIHSTDPVFILQDGPPYANGDLHLGHAFNKILKDFVIKTKNFSGYRVPFIPGWDCHGLPIEIQVEKKLGKQSHQLDRSLFINKCREYANLQVDNQKQQFIRLGIIADWEHPYLTMDFKFAAQVIRTLGKILAKGHIVRGDRPVHWCLNCGSALAEAEVEYKQKKSESIYVAFDCSNNQEIFSKFKLDLNHVDDDLPLEQLKVSVLIWTTTPWTIPAIYGVAINPKFMYCLLYSKDHGRILMVAEQLIPVIINALSIKDYMILAKCVGEELEYTILQHPIYANRLIPVILGDHVTLEVGTGCVTTAPAHGHDDYIVGKKYNLPVINFINNRGCFLAASEFFTGLHINKAAEQVLTMLAENSQLLAAAQILHSYPHCWRHKTPIIFMATPQWFISMEKQELRAKALEAVRNVTWVPGWGQNRMEGMLQLGRPDWCISRQRTWGVPIPFFLHKDTNELHPQQLELLEQVAQAVEQNGIEAWYQLNPEQLLGADANNYIKSTDIVDVWFESGAVNSCITATHAGITNEADLYLEGSDQHRGWFQSSLLISVAVTERAPYKQVLTHGFILDLNGNKMSKSLGNVISPKDIIQKYGADVLRLWVATTDYSGDLKIAEEILKRVSDGYRRIRNTARFLLANLHDFNPKENLVAPENLLLLDRKMLATAMELQAKIIECYDQYKYHLAYQKIHNFCVEELGSFYLDIIKDRQYTCKKDAIPRRSAQTALYYILEALVKWIAPILSFTAEEIWKYMSERQVNSVFLTGWFQGWPDLGEYDLRNEEFWEGIFAVKKEVNKQIENARNSGIIGSNLEAAVIIDCGIKVYEILNSLNPELKFLFITSEVKLSLNRDREPQFIKVTINSTNYPKCARCWHRVKVIDHKKLCDRCQLNITNKSGEHRKYV